MAAIHWSTHKSGQSALGPISAISYQEHLLTIYDAADRFRVHRSYIYELINTGVLPHPIKLERAARFKASDLDEAIGALSIECSITKPHWISSMGRTARRRSSVNFHK